MPDPDPHWALQAGRLVACCTTLLQLDLETLRSQVGGDALVHDIGQLALLAQPLAAEFRRQRANWEVTL